jgi:hypothetical protein
MKTKTAIDEIIYELNDVFGIDNPEGFYFVYETNGWYECIRFNEHVLWDSDDCRAMLSERPDWDEDDWVYDDEDEDTVGCIKRRFNDYINQLKGYRFDVPTKRNKMYEIGDAVDEILDELPDFDEDVIDKLYETFVNVIEKYN